VIKSFRNRDLERLWTSGQQIPQKTLTTRTILRVVDAIDAATSPYDVAFTGNRFDEWIENVQLRYGAMITDHWLVSFSWSAGHAIDVDLERLD
jgi:plasmid maintenance system killer protein